MRPGLKLVPPGLALIGVTYGLARFAYGLFLPAIRADVTLTPTLAGRSAAALTPVTASLSSPRCC